MVAVGEVGVDHSEDPSAWPQQMEIDANGSIIYVDPQYVVVPGAEIALPTSMPPIESQGQAIYEYSSDDINGVIAH